MEIDSVSLPPPEVKQVSDSQAGLAVARGDGEKTRITAPFPPIKPASEVFPLPTDVRPDNSSLNHRSTSSHPPDRDSIQSQADTASQLIDGHIANGSREASLPYPFAVQPVPGPAESSSAVHQVLRPSSPARMIRTGYIYDPLMMLHCKDGYTPTSDNVIDMTADGHPEEPMRIKRIFSRLAESGLIKRMKRIDFAQVTFDQVLLVHSADHWDKVQGTESTPCSTPWLAELTPSG